MACRYCTVRDVEIELVVGTDGEEFPAVRLVLGQIVVDNHRFGRVIEVDLDLLNLRDLRELGDVEGAVGESEAVRAIESRVECLDLASASLVCNGVDLVQDTAAHEQGALVALAQRTRIGETACIDFDLKARGCFQLRDRQFVGGCWEWGRHDGREIGANCCLRATPRPWWGGLTRGRYVLASGWAHDGGTRGDG